MSAPKQPLRLVNAATDLLREAIVSGQLRPGGRLLQEQLAEELGISRTPLREALLRLEQQGLVTTVGRRGLAVAKLSRESLLDNRDIRGILDTLAARWAAERVTVAELAELHAVHDRARACIEKWHPEGWVAANIEFHLHILRGSHSVPLERAMPVGRMPVRLLVDTTYFEHGQAKLDFSEHQLILDAIDARDSDRAEAAARAHVDRVRAALIEQLHDGGTGLPRVRRMRSGVNDSDRRPAVRRG